MKKVFGICLLISAVGFAAQKNVNGEFGVGVGFSNEMYKVEKKSTTSLLPVGTLSYKNFYLSDSELGASVMFGENVIFSGFVDFRDGYSVKGEKLENGYKTFKNRKEQVAFGGRLGYLAGNFESYVSSKGGKRGSTSEVGLNYTIPFGERFAVTSGINYSVYSKKYTDYYFGIHKDDLGGKLKKEYKPGRATSVGMQLGAEYKFTDNFSTFALVSAERFSKEIFNSPVVKSRTSVVGGIGVKYSF